jgi:hypothetical protein
VKGNRHNYNQYTCGQLHDRRNPDWRKLENLWKYCEETGFDPYAAIDAIEERIGVKLVCDCQIINNEIENRRKALANAFGADLGEPGRDFAGKVNFNYSIFWFTTTEKTIYFQDARCLLILTYR